MLFLKKIIALFLVFAIFTINVCAEKTVSSECDISDIDVLLEAVQTNTEMGTVLDINAKSVILMEVNTAQILYENNADEKLAPASITKIMPLLLVMEALQKGTLSLETVVYASAHACSMGGSQIWLEEGEGMTVDELLKATVIASANDACVALGEAIAGSEEGFVALMNERAKELGMTNTVFKNCTGLDAEGHVTSAHDVAIMSCELLKHELIKKYSTVWMDTLREGESELVNTNKLVRFYEGTTGLKTGTTSQAKYCLSASAKRDGLELVAVVMAGESSNDRFNGAKKMLDYGFANYTFTKLDANLKNDLTVDLQKGTKKNIKVGSNEIANVLLMKNETGKITRTTEWNKNIEAPIKKGDVVGYVNIYVGETQVGRLKIFANESVERATFWYAFCQIFENLFKL